MDGSEKYIFYNKYMIPTVGFMKGATKKNKMTVEHGRLFKDGKRVEEAVSIQKGLQHFSDWISNETNEIILVRKCLFYYSY